MGIEIVVARSSILIWFLVVELVKAREINFSRIDLLFETYSKLHLFIHVINESEQILKSSSRLKLMSTFIVVLLLGGDIYRQ